MSPFQDHAARTGRPRAHPNESLRIERLQPGGLCSSCGGSQAPLQACVDTTRAAVTSTPRSWNSAQRVRSLALPRRYPAPDRRGAPARSRVRSRRGDSGCRASSRCGLGGTASGGNNSHAWTVQLRLWNSMSARCRGSSVKPRSRSAIASGQAPPLDHGSESCGHAPIGGCEFRDARWRRGRFREHALRPACDDERGRQRRPERDAE